MRNWKTLACFALAVALVLLLSGCGSTPEGSEKGRLKFAYICKDLSHDWFQRVLAGLEKKCKELDVDFVSYDAEFSDELCMEALERAIENGTDGIAICTTNQKLGPEIAAKCKKAGIPLITIDDTMSDESGQRLPHIGMATRELGTLGGRALAKMAAERDFFRGGNRVKVLQIDVSELSVIAERLEGYRMALMASTPLMLEDFVVVDSKTGMYDENLKALGSITALLQEPTHWIVTGINDDCAIAGMAALREIGFPMDNVIACGLGGYLMSAREFESGNGNYIVTITQPDQEGEKAIEMLYSCVTKDVQLSDLVVLGGKVATVDNFRMFFNMTK